MFSHNKQAFSPTGQTPTMLEEHLIDENDVELAPKAAPTTADDIGAEIDAKMIACNIQMLEETDDEKRERLSVQEKWDSRVMIAYTCFVATAGEYSLLYWSDYHTVHLHLPQYTTDPSCL